MIRKLFSLEPEDTCAIAKIQKRFGYASQSQAVRTALRWLAQMDAAALGFPPVTISKNAKGIRPITSLRGSWKRAIARDLDVSASLRELRNAWEDELLATIKGGATIP